MEDLSVFVGYRGHSRRYEEIVTPGIYRKHNAPCKELHETWIRKSRIACNVLKQRFFETHGKPLTDIEARGILQHHYVIGPTDMLDLSYDLGVAKWFALNTLSNGRYSRRHFHETCDRQRAIDEAVFIYKVVVRAIGSIEVAGEAMRFLTPGVELKPWFFAVFSGLGLLEGGGDT
jgi:FRG domain